MYRAEDSVGEDSDDDMDYKDEVEITLQSKQRYDSGESGVFGSSSSCPCGCGKEFSGHQCIRSSDSGKESSEDTSSSASPSSLYIPSSYITNKLSEVAGTSLTCVISSRSEEPLDMSKTSATYQSINKKRESCGVTKHQSSSSSHRDLFPGLYLLVDTALGTHPHIRHAQHVAPV